MSRFPFLALAAAAALSGCSMFGGTLTDLVFETSATEYAPGDTVSVILENESDEAVGYNICFAFLELERNGEVVPAGLGPDESTVCQANLPGLAPGEVAEGVAYLPDDLEAGTYRLATEVEVGDDRQRVVTNSFGVR